MGKTLMKNWRENQESKDADPTKIAEIENLRTKLFADALNMDYPAAIRQCHMKGNKVFIPKTKEENDLWIDFWSETSNNKFLFSSAFYPKICRNLFTTCQETFFENLGIFLPQFK
ncbi:hypothetical protein Avbf_13012 [Armadillidium vulgare]|nr:hypothetical protein Avbf_13012 [Armadillidium vulgare]